MFWQRIQQIFTNQPPALPVGDLTLAPLPTPIISLEVDGLDLSLDIDDLHNIVNAHQLPEYVCQSIPRSNQHVHRMRVLGYIQVQANAKQRRAARYAILRRAIECSRGDNLSRTPMSLIKQILKQDPRLASASKGSFLNDEGLTLLYYAATAENILAMDLLLAFGAVLANPESLALSRIARNPFYDLLYSYAVNPEVLARVFIQASAANIDSLSHRLASDTSVTLDIAYIRDNFQVGLQIAANAKANYAIMLAFTGAKNAAVGKKAPLLHMLKKDGGKVISLRVMEYLFEPYIPSQALIDRHQLLAFSNYKSQLRAYLQAAAESDSKESPTEKIRQARAALRR